MVLDDSLQAPQPTPTKSACPLTTICLFAGTQEPVGNGLAGPRKPDMTVKLEAKPHMLPAAKAEAKSEAPAPAPAKKSGQLFLPQPSTVKNAYLLMAQNK